MNKNTNIARRHRAEQRFRLYGVLSLAFAGCMLLLLLISLGQKGIKALYRHELILTVDARAIPENADWYNVSQQALYQAIGVKNPEMAQKRELAALVGFFTADSVKQHVLALPQDTRKATLDIAVPLSDIGDLTLKGDIDRTLDPLLRPISDRQLQWLDQWQREGHIVRTFNRDFFTRGDSRAPEAAGFLGSIVGSLFTVMLCMLAALPVAVMAAITLEEFARKSRVAEWLEIAINNLAAVPSIIYGLLGLTVFIQLFGLPRSSSLVGGLTLALLVMPVMIIAARAAIRAVPPSMRQAAAALGATPLQVVCHHVIPYALPGILTGTILSVARAIGESAPLLMIGMVAFVADIPRSPLEAATAMPVQIYLWAASPQLGYAEKTSAGILVLLFVLLLLNALAISLRKRSLLRWN